jgi:hypothetical protein
MVRQPGVFPHFRMAVAVDFYELVRAK